MNNFQKYLLQHHYAATTVRRYLYHISTFLYSYPKAAQCTYRDILNYMEEQNKHQLSPVTRQSKLTAIKKYYDYLLEQGIREDHPCRNLNIKGKGKRGIIFADLFTTAELERLIQRQETYPHLKNKNQLIASLLIHQALLPQEITQLKTHHIDLDAGTIYIKAGRINTSRTLELHRRQYRIIDQYLNETRKRLIQTCGQNTDYLILNYRGKPATIDDIQFLIETAKPLFPDRNLTIKTIRDSVIANMLNEKKLPLEQVQLFAGHRWISSTLRCRQESMDEQREILNKFHPLG